MHKLHCKKLNQNLLQLVLFNVRSLSEKMLVLPIEVICSSSISRFNFYILQCNVNKYILIIKYYPFILLCTFKHNIILSVVIKQTVIAHFLSFSQHKSSSLIDFNQKLK